MKEEKHTNDIKLEGGTYEIIRSRLQNHGQSLHERIKKLNASRKEIFGAIDTQLIANALVTTTNKCVPRDMVPVGDCFLFGYNVHLGLRTELQVSDVFSVYRFEKSDHSFHLLPEEDSFYQSIWGNKRFEEDLHNLYRYYKNTVFAKFAVIGPHLFMVFQISTNVSDIKTFKWRIRENEIEYLGNRFDHEFRFPEQHEFKWERTNRDMHRRGLHPHISIKDRVFVETIGGDLTIKVEDNTSVGRGIYSEEVEHKNQKLDDAEIYFADLGNIIVLKIRPYQERDFRYIVFNEKIQEALRIDSLENSCVLLPDDHGLIFSDGYYLKTGEYKIFDNKMGEMHFEKRLLSPNGEDFLYVFYNQISGIYVLMPYNLVDQKVEGVVVCNGYSIFSDGELCYFKAEEEDSKSHRIEIWQTPYTEDEYLPEEHSDTYLHKVGNKTLVRGMAECNELLTILGKNDESYTDLYVDLVKKAGDILDTYYWLNHKECFQLYDPLKAIRETAEAAIDEFEKVRRIKENTNKQLEFVREKVTNLLYEIRSRKPRSVDEFVHYLADLRSLRGETISLKELRYVDLEIVSDLEIEVGKKMDELSEQCVRFLLDEEALAPYHASVKEQRTEVEGVDSVMRANRVGEAIDGIAKELELLIEVVGNLKIEDATQTTRIIDNISSIYATINQLRSTLKRRRKELQSSEARAEFNAQIKLVNQAVINYLDLCDTPERCEEYLTRLMVQLEELEGKFTEFEEFIEQVSEKREEIYNAFESRKLGLVEARNRRAAALSSAAERILKGIRNRVKSFKEVNEINSYFASDLMIDKLRDIVSQLIDLNDSVKADDIQSQMKVVQEDAIRQLKDRNELFVGGANVIKFGRHHFSVNVQALDLTIVPKGDEMYYHLTGTNFFEKIENEDFMATKPVWNQSLISENSVVYRAEYLAYRILKELESGDSVSMVEFYDYSIEQVLEFIQKFMASRYNEGYIKGVHDHDSSLILKELVHLHQSIGLLRYTPEARALASTYWHGFASEEEKQLLNHRLKGAGVILQLFPETHEFDTLIDDIREKLEAFVRMSSLFDIGWASEAARYLFYELAYDDSFTVSGDAADLYKNFLQFLKRQKFYDRFQASVANLKGNPENQFQLIFNWLRAFVERNAETVKDGVVWETSALIFRGEYKPNKVKTIHTRITLEGMTGDHGVIQQGEYVLDYTDFIRRLGLYDREVVPMFEHYTELKKSLADTFRKELRLDEFKPRVLSSFVRNQLIDQVYLPLIGDNLAKQIGVVGENKRTDRMGMLLLISPPGYGKTTLMEYIANRLGIIFMKINGPAIGHQVTSLDPVEAPNAAAREELKKLNLALEMGDNVMIYLDDIQHCNPEFLQKFISLCDGQRKIEGVYKGQTRTYDLRGRKVAVVMAGNPYTESGEKFRIPDMLANRADTYNLGDIIGGSDFAFKLSYVENALTSNAILAKLATHPRKDILSVIRLAETGNQEGLQFESNFSTEDLNEYVSVLEKLLVIRDIILKVNQEYIRSAGQEDDYRTEPAFQLQGSYRNMNKLVEKVVPIMNDEELTQLILSHYENESQTLTKGAEANLLKFKELVGWLDVALAARWEEIKDTFKKNQALRGLGSDRMAQVIAQMATFTEGLQAIREVLEKGLKEE